MLLLAKTSNSGDGGHSGHSGDILDAKGSNDTTYIVMLRIIHTDLTEFNVDDVNSWPATFERLSLLASEELIALDFTESTLS